LGAVVVAASLLAGCSRAQTKADASAGEARPEVRVDLSAQGLPKGFFAAGSDRKCAGQIIGYRFVVWLDNGTVAVGFNTSPNCRPSPSQMVHGMAKILAFDVSGHLKASRDLPYEADGDGIVVADGEAKAGPAGTLLFRVQELHQSKSGILLLDASLKNAGEVNRFLEQTTFLEHALVFQEGFTISGPRTYSVLNGAPIKETARWKQDWPVGTMDRKFGEHEIAYLLCQQELRPNENGSSNVVYAGAKRRCTMIVETDDQKGWMTTLEQDSSGEIIGVLADGSVVGHISVKGSRAGKLVIWAKDQPSKELPWIPGNYCGSVESATADMSRYAAFASDACNDMGGIFRLLGVGHDGTDTGRWIVFDRRSQTPLADRVFPKNARAALSPDGLRYATFEAGELRIYGLPKPNRTESHQ
jgi:hypothetical protein